MGTNEEAHNNENRVIIVLVTAIVPAVPRCSISGSSLISRRMLEDIKLDLKEIG
jgi:hypothetical protein